MKIAIILILALCVCGVRAQWVKQSVDTTASLRGLAVVNEKIVWASGTGGTVIRTIDGGKTWKVMTVPGAEKLDFRDIEAFDANTAYILSIGNGESSRIYKTTDGGRKWKLQFTNDDPKKFFDAIACVGRYECYAVSDPVAGIFPFIETSDGVRDWYSASGSYEVRASAGEAAFAASGTCLIRSGQNLFFVTGGSAAKVYKLQIMSGDHGIDSPPGVSTPIVSGSAGSGIFSIAMFDHKNGVIVGGNYEKPNEAKDNLAFTSDGGKTWKLETGLTGYRSGVAYVDKTTIVAVGTNGTDLSLDGGTTWKKISEINLNAVATFGKNATWAVGPNGVVVRQTETVLKRAASGARGKPHYQWPVGNVDSVKLSHTKIAGDCGASDSACSIDQVVEVTVRAAAFEETPLEYIYVVTGGRVVGNGSNVQWDLVGVKPGTYTITAKACKPKTDPKWGCLGLTRTEQIVIR